MLDPGKDIKCAIKQKCTEREYHIEDSKDVSQISVKISCATTHLPALSFCGLHAKPNGVIGLSKHDHLRLDPKLGHGKCSIKLVLCAFIAFTTMLDKP